MMRLYSDTQRYWEASRIALAARNGRNSVARQRGVETLQQQLPRAGA